MCSYCMNTYFIGMVSTIAGGTKGYCDGTGSNAQFNEPAGITIDGKGNLLVADESNHRIRLVTPQGNQIS
jgi:hypothetical protein